MPNNPWFEQKTLIDKHTELLPIHIAADQVLAGSETQYELYEIRASIRDLRFASMEDRSNNPPIFNRISYYHSAIYVLKNQTVYEGQWHDSHLDIAQTNDVSEVSDYDSNTQLYISCHTFSLTNVPSVKILVLDTMQGFKSEDLVILTTLGYSVMSPLFEWLIVDTKQNGGMKKIESQLA